ncbi:lysylphosphatidylglycerol synthase transmembrane domain-containing protein [Verrucomicrobiota bacterium]
MHGRHKRFLIPLVKLFLTGLLIGVIAYRVDLTASFRILSRANLAPVTGALMFYLLAAVARAWRFCIICRTEGPTEFRRMLGPYCLSVGYGTFFSPGEDAYKLFAVNKDWDHASRLACVLLDRLTGAMGLMLSALLGIVIAFLSGHWEMRQMLPTVVIGGCVGFVIVMVSGVVLKYSARLKFASWLNTLVEKIYWAARRSKDFFIKKPKACLKVLAVSVGIQLLIVTPIFFLAWLAVGGTASFAPFFLAFVPIVAACNALPISFLGIGVRDVSFLYLMRTVGGDDERAIATTMLVLLVRVVSSIILLVLGHMAEKSCPNRG